MRGRVAMIAGAVALAAAGLVATRAGGSGFDWRAASGGADPVPLASFALASGRYELRAFVDAGGDPAISYAAPGRAGGRHFRAGWAMEPQVLRAGDRDVVFGVTIAEAASVLVATDGTPLRIATRTLPGLPFRWFAATTPPGSHVGSLNDAGAYDGRGELLGRPHWNTGTRSAPDTGRFDGRWDRERFPGHR